LPRQARSPHGLKLCRQIDRTTAIRAQYYVSRIAAICGTDFEEDRTPAAALERPPGAALIC
jgi:hypothetical protein